MVFLQYLGRLLLQYSKQWSFKKAGSRISFRKRTVLFYQYTQKSPFLLRFLFFLQIPLVHSCHWNMQGTVLFICLSVYNNVINIHELGTLTISNICMCPPQSHFHAASTSGTIILDSEFIISLLFFLYISLNLHVFLKYLNKFSSLSVYKMIIF